MTLAELRREYAGRPLSRENLNPDPVAQFQTWFQEALKAEVPDANAMTLATVSAAGIPSGRIVLLKEIDSQGLTFYTNYASQKGRELAGNPWATGVFYWVDLSRQVRITGPTEKVSPAESEAYFKTRPRESQLAAWASRQSNPLESRSLLEQRYAGLAARFEGQEVPLPRDWGGYRLIPHAFEFWQGRPSRLHDRFLYERQRDESWNLQRLNP